MTDETYYDKALRICKGSHKNLILSRLKIYDKEFFDDVMARTAWMSEKANLGKRVLFIDSGFSYKAPTCNTCGKEHENQLHDRAEVSQWCCKRCMFDDKQFMKERLMAVDQKARVKKMVETNMERYGHAYTSQRPDKKHHWQNSGLNWHNPAALKKLQDRVWVEEQYVTERRSGLSIAGELGVHYSTVLDFVSKHGFKVRGTSRSEGERLISKFITEELGLEVKDNYRPEGRKECDIYVPSKKVGFEFNGVFWHGARGEDDDYGQHRHMNKTKYFNGLGIRIVHFSDQQWMEKPEICKSIIRSSLGKNNNRVYARHCEIVELTAKEANQFFDGTHISGGSKGACFFYGLKHGDELVMAISLTKPRFTKDHDLEIARMASCLNMTVVGGASRLFSCVKKKHAGLKLMTYADLSYGTGNVYRELGMTFVRNTSPGYQWVHIKDGRVLSRYQTMKKNLPDLFPGCDLSKTEVSILEDNGFLRMFDCGHAMFETVL